MSHPRHAFAVRLSHDTTASTHQKYSQKWYPGLLVYRLL